MIVSDQEGHFGCCVSFLMKCVVHWTIYLYYYENRYENRTKYKKNKHTVKLIN